MAKDLNLKLKITADGKTAVGEINRVTDAVGHIGEGAPGAKKADDSIKDLGHTSDGVRDRVDNLATGLKALAGAAVVREFVQVNASMESMTKALEAVTGSSAAAQKEMAFIREESTRLGLELGTAANSYTQLAASAKGTALEGAKTREIWTAVAESMARLGKTSAETDGALLAISQMMSKGVVSAEELRGQLGERLPGAFNVAAKAVGVTTQELGKMLESGQVIASDFLPKFAAELHKTGGSGGAVNTFAANLSRLKNALGEVGLAVGETGLFSTLSWGLAKTADGISFATLGFKGLAAAIGGNQADLAELRQQLEASRNRLLGVQEAADKAADGFSRMGTSAGVAADHIERAVSDKIVQAMIKLDGSIKNTDEAFKKLGVDPGEIIRGISAAEREIIESFKRLAADPNINGEALTASLLAALGQVSQEAVPEIGFAFKVAANQGRQSTDLLAVGLNALTTKAQGLWSEMETGAKKTEALADAYKTLGITSQAALTETANKARDAYDIIVKQGGTLADQAAAWKAYAEKAIAANGGVASSVIQAQAAQHGYTLAIDESGKASVRLKEVLEDTARAAIEAANAARAATTAAMESASIAASQARTSIGSMQGSIDDFHARLSGLGDGLASAMNLARQSVFDTTKGSIAAMEELRGYMRSNVGWGYSGGISDYINHVYEGVQNITAAYHEQMALARRYTEAINSGADSTRDAFTATQLMASQMQYLGDQDLAPLRTAIADAERRMLDLRDAAQSTLDNIQDEWDQLNNNLDEIEQRRADKRRAEVEAQLAAARAGGDRAAIADLERSLQLLRDITAARIADARQRETEARNKTAAPATASPATASPATASAAPGTVQIIVNGLVTSSPSEIAQILKPELDKLMRLGA